MGLAALIAVVGVSTAYATAGRQPGITGGGSAPTAVPRGSFGSAQGAGQADSAAPSPGCGQRPDPGPTMSVPLTGDVAQTLTVGSATRTYRLSVPAHYRPGRPTPLILLFQGSGSSALQTSIYTQMPARAGRAGYLVATPDAVDAHWQLSVPDAPTADLQFVTTLITDLSSRYCLDRSRVYATGISLGSVFASIVGCTGADRIAAIGLVAAEFLLRPCEPPLPVVAFHGTADPLVPYRGGGSGRSLPGVPLSGAVANMGQWAVLDGCRSTPRVQRYSSMVIRRVWPHCRSGSAVVFYTVQGGGHTWPGSPVTLSVGAFGPTTHQVDATATMLDFFGRHARSG